MGREFEFKFRASVRQMEAIRADFEGFREISMVSSYYDTQNQDLFSRHWTLRKREENGISVCALKTPSADGARCEWEVECADIDAAVDALIQCGAPEELKALASGGLEKVCSARFIRQAAIIEQEGCTVELALDRGILLGGARMQLLGEVEVELKSGSDSAAIAFARTLATNYGLIPERTSKYMRALDLTGRI